MTDTVGSPAPSLSARGLSCSLGGRPVLSGIDLEFRGGELCGLIGPNGSGKSTLLSCLAGLLPCEGEVLVDGEPMGGKAMRERARAVALMHQQSSLDLPFSARDVVLMGRWPWIPRWRGETARDMAAADAAMEFTDTARLSSRPVTRMSGGERQRVFFAKTIAQDAPVILLDEPSASLDIAYQEQIFAHAKRLAASGRTVIVAVHDVRLAARHCDRLILLARGSVVATGPADAVLTPENLRSAYGMNLRVWRDHVTGLIDYHPVPPGIEGVRPHVHVLGGGGSATPVLRMLAGAGYRVTMGVLSPGDSDLQVASVHGMSVVTCDPFSPIGDAAFRENCELSASAQTTILCDFAWGLQNLRNLEAALCARNLLVVEDGDPSARDFTGGKAMEIYKEARSKGIAVRGIDLEAELAAGGNPES